jgi:hypothetical protein
MERRTTRLGSNKSAFRTLHRRICGQGTVLPGTWLPCGTTVSRRSPVPRPATSVAEPLNGPGREPSASESALARHSRGRRIRPAWVTPPRPSFRSVPLQTPLEAPLIGQDTRRIRQVLETGIGIHSQVRERHNQRTFRSPDGVKRNPGQYCHADGIPDFASLHPGYELRAASRPGHGSLANFET